MDKCPSCGRELEPGAPSTPSGREAVLLKSIEIHKGTIARLEHEMFNMRAQLDFRSVQIGKLLSALTKSRDTISDALKDVGESPRPKITKRSPT